MENFPRGAFTCLLAGGGNMDKNKLNDLIKSRTVESISKLVATPLAGTRNGDGYEYRGFDTGVNLLLIENYILLQMPNGSVAVMCRSSGNMVHMPLKYQHSPYEYLARGMMTMAVERTPTAVLPPVLAPPPPVLAPPPPAVTGGFVQISPLTLLNIILVVGLAVAVGVLVSKPTPTPEVVPYRGESVNPEDFFRPLQDVLINLTSIVREHAATSINHEQKLASQDAMNQDQEQRLITVEKKLKETKIKTYSTDVAVFTNTTTYKTNWTGTVCYYGGWVVLGFLFMCIPECIASYKRDYAK